MKIEESIESILNNHIKEIWITPYLVKKYIPNEELSSLKEELITLLKRRLTNGDKS